MATTMDEQREVRATKRRKTAGLCHIQCHFGHSGNLPKNEDGDPDLQHIALPSSCFFRRVPPPLPTSIWVEHIIPCLDPDERINVAACSSEIYRQCQLQLPPFPRVCLKSFIPELGDRGYPFHRRKNNRTCKNKRKQYVRSVALSPITTDRHGRSHHEWIACGCRDGTIHLYNCFTGEQQVLCHDYDDCPIFLVEFSPTRSYQLVSASWGCDRHPDAVYVWDLRTTLPRVAELGPFVATYINRPTFPVVFSPDGQFLALAGYQITIWSMDDPEAADADEDSNKENCDSSKTIGSDAAEKDTKRGCLGLPTMTLTKAYSWGRDDYPEEICSSIEVKSMAFLPSVGTQSRSLATSCSRERGLRIWDLAPSPNMPSGKPSSFQVAQDFWVDQIAASSLQVGEVANTAYVATACQQDCQIRLWAMSDWTCVRTIDSYGIRPRTLRFVSECVGRAGPILMAGDCQRSLLLWNVCDGTLVNGIPCRQFQVTTMSTSPLVQLPLAREQEMQKSSSTFVTMSSDGTVRLWELCLDRKTLEQARQKVMQIISPSA